MIILQGKREKLQKILVTLIALSVLCLSPMAFAANPDTIDITVRIKSVGLMCNQSEWAIGWVEAGSTSSTAGEANWSNVENTGNSEGDFHAVCSNSTNWTLGTAGTDIFGFAIRTWGTNGSHNGTWHAIADWQDNDTFATHIDPDAKVYLGLRFYAPLQTSIASQQEFNLTLSIVLI